MKPVNSIRVGLAWALAASCPIIAILGYGSVAEGQVIGWDTFSHPDGPIDGLSGGEGFDWDDISGIHTGTVSDWDDSSNVTVVTTGRLVVLDSQALRQNNGPSEGVTDDGNPSDERLGAIRNNGQVWVRWKMRVEQTFGGCNWAGVGISEFGTEHAFIGIPNRCDDNPLFGVDDRDSTVDFSGEAATPGVDYLLICVIDYDADYLGLWINPTSPDELSNILLADAAIPFTSTQWTTGVTISSGGMEVSFDELVLARNATDVFAPLSRMTFETGDLSEWFVDCGPLPAPANGSVDDDPSTSGSVATYSCDTGYDLVGSSTRTCGTDGVWGGIAPICQIVDCGALSSPVNGTVDDDPSTYGSVAAYSCNIGYHLTGAATRICQSGGAWSGTAPTCDIDECGSLSPPANGDVTLTGTEYLDTATYSCDLGFVLDGGTNLRVCGADGIWTGIAPTCIPEGSS